MIELLEQTLGGTFDRIQRRLGPRARAAVGWLRDNAEPPIGVLLHASDGAEYTGVIVVVRNRPIAMLAAREPGTSRPPLVTPPPAPSRHDPYGSYSRDGIYERRGWEDGELPFR